MLARTEERYRRASLLPVIINSDGVALGQTNQQANTALGMFANCSDFFLKQPCSKFCFGYIPKLKLAKEAVLSHLTIVAGLTMAAAERAYFCFEHSIDQEFWKMIIEPIIKANKHGVYMSLLGYPNHVLLTTSDTLGMSLVRNAC
jgi:hypothetical protein